MKPIYIFERFLCLIYLGSTPYLKNWAHSEYNAGHYLNLKIAILTIVFYNINYLPTKLLTFTFLKGILKSYEEPIKGNQRIVGAVRVYVRGIL